MTRLTVAICTYRRPDKLRRALAAIARQSILDELDVLVVDDGSGDTTPGVVAEFPFARRVAHDRNRGLATARNTALDAARGEWILFTDDDCRPLPDWAHQVLEGAHRRPDAFALGGRVTATPAPGLVNDFLRSKSPFVPLELSLVEGRGFWHRLREYLKRSAQSEIDADDRLVAAVAGASMAVRRSVATELGGWDDAFVFGGEEEELFRRALAAGFDIAYDPRAQVEHDFDNTLSDLLRRSYVYGRGNARSHAKYGGVPTLYPAPALVLAGLVAGARLPVLAVAGGLLPLAVFSIWVRQAVARREARPLLFAYLQVLQETASNVGWLRERAGRGRSLAAPSADRTGVVA